MRQRRFNFGEFSGGGGAYPDPSSTLDVLDTWLCFPQSTVKHKQSLKHDKYLFESFFQLGIENVESAKIKSELQRWFGEMNDDTRKDPNQSNKMRTYRKVKTIDNYRCEDYLHQVTYIRHRNFMTKLRLSNHRLAIETRCYTRPYKKPNEGICPLCRKEAEDEKHFLVSFQFIKKKGNLCLNAYIKNLKSQL